MIEKDPGGEILTWFFFIWMNIFQFVNCFLLFGLLWLLISRWYLTFIFLNTWRHGYTNQHLVVWIHGDMDTPNNIHFLDTLGHGYTKQHFFLDTWRHGYTKQHLLFWIHGDIDIPNNIYFLDTWRHGYTKQHLLFGFVEIVNMSVIKKMLYRLWTWVW